MVFMVNIHSARNRMFRMVGTRCAGVPFRMVIALAALKIFSEKVTINLSTFAVVDGSRNITRMIQFP